MSAPHVAMISNPGGAPIVSPNIPTADMNVVLGFKDRSLASSIPALVGGPQLFHTPFAKAFFSTDNVRTLQNALRMYVYVQSGHQYIIEPQNETTLHVIMRAAFEKYYLNLYDPTVDSSCRNPVHADVRALNMYMIEICGDPLLDAARGHLQYLADREAPFVSPADPMITSVRSEKTIINPFVTENRVQNYRQWY